MGNRGVCSRATSQGQEARFGLWLCKCVNLNKSFRLKLPVKHSLVRHIINYLAPSWHKLDAQWILILLSACRPQLKTFHPLSSKRLPLNQNRWCNHFMGLPSGDVCLLPPCFEFIGAHAEKEWYKSGSQPPYFTDGIRSHCPQHSQDKHPSNQVPN